MRKARVAPLLALCGVLAAAPAMAEVFTVTLTNGTTFESRYRPRQASWDTGMLEFLNELGTWVALPKTLVTDIAAQSETRGFGRVIDTTTVDLGIAPNDLPQETAGQVSPADALAQAFNRNYDIQQFVEPGDVGGGLPVGYGSSGGAAPNVTIQTAPPAAPAPPPPGGQSR